MKCHYYDSRINEVSSSISLELKFRYMGISFSKDQQSSIAPN